MQNSRITRTLRAGTALVGVAVLALAIPAFAQDTPPPQPQPQSSAATPDQDSDIIVTGSRLSERSVTAQPISVITGDSLSNLGYTNIGTALTQLPIFGVPGNSNVGSQGSFGAGQTFVNMYDLGAQRTLTLVNGNRFVSSGSSSIFGSVQGAPVDLGQIAPGLVERIDVVSVGGAPIYGSDAIAGTVNVILKKDYQGLSLTASDGISGHGDARDYNVSLLAGHNFADGRGNITLNVYYDHQDGLASSQRSATDGDRIFNGTDPTRTYSYARFNGGLHYTAFTNTGIPMFTDGYPGIYQGAAYAAITNAEGQALYFNQAGHLVPFQDGIVLRNGYTEAGGDGFAIGNYSNLLANNQRIQGTLLANYDFSDKLHFHGEFWLGRSKATNVIDQPYYNSSFFFGPPNLDLPLSSSNPFLSAADQATIQAQSGDTFYLARANTDLSTGAFTTTTTLIRGVAGLDGKFNVGKHDFTWEATFNYGRTVSHTDSRELVTQNFANALDAVLDPAGTGNIICNPGYTNATIPTISSTCAPLDIFGLGNASQAALNYITALARTRQVDTQLDFVADIKGDLVTLPAGKVSFVLGYEHRRESQSFDPGAFYRGELQPDGTYLQYGGSIPITPVSGAYDTNEGFAELKIPLISPDMHTIIRSFDLNGAARYTSNSLTGGFWSYTGGGSLSPFNGLTFRGNYTRSFRSPSVTELYAPKGSVYELADDPCDARYIGSGPNPTVRAANCAAAGLPADFLSYVVDASMLGSSSGNAHLQNEKANSWTAGGVFSPRFLPGLTLTADYVSIDITNEITEPGLTSLMNACYDSTSYPSAPTCSDFTRDASGQVVDFQDNYINIAVEHFRAVQATLNYTLPLRRLGLPESAGALQLSANWLHTIKHDYKVGTDDQQLVLGSYADPKDAVQGNIDWATKGFDWLWQVTYYGKTLVDPNAGAGTYEYPVVSPYWMVNTSIGIKATDNFSLRLIVDNVFNLGVPSPYTSFSSNKAFDALMGRYFRLNVTVNF